ncbi:hypothetical protein FB446DRAFT_313909 [Lentinula raphanica]|nr:hypothetical protein FB446DRAFT_313909 [Lentinula raphanica]
MLSPQDLDEQHVLRLQGVRIINQQTKYLSPLDMPSSWDRALDGVHLPTENTTDNDSPPNIYLVTGPKKVGKSSFARALSNRLLSRHHQVAYLDLDPGQSEFTPGGLLALSLISRPILGPPFTHPTIPARSHFLGAFSPKASPGLYIESVKDLVQFWARELGWGTGQHQRQGNAVPLVVNTMGWTKGLGADLMSTIQDILLDGLSQVSFEASLAFGTIIGRGELSKEEADIKLPTLLHSYEFDQQQTAYPTQSIPLPSYPFSGNTIISASGNAIISASYAPQNQFPVQIHPIEPVPIPDSSSSVIPSYLSSYTAADHRAISIMSYFHAIFPSSPSPDYPRFHDSPFPSSVTASTWDTSLPLLARPPYQVDVERAIDRVFLRGVGEAGEVVQEEIERVLGGAVISLISCESGTLDDLTLSHSKRQVTKIPYIPSASPASYPSPSNSTAIGLALIRSVVPGGMHLHVLTPLPLNVIETARVIIKGEMELPIWGFVDSRNTGTRKERGSGGARGGDNEDNVHREVPFLQWDRVVGLGAEKRRVRRNLMRKGQGV